MRKFSFVLLAVIFSVFFTSCELIEDADDLFDRDGRDRRIAADELPASVLDYLSTNYPEFSVKYAEVDPDYYAYYEVRLSNGLELYFDRQGNFLGIDDDDAGNDDQRINADQLPDTIISYIENNYPNATIRYAEIDPDYFAYYEVKLSNGLELYFDAEGKFLGVDDD